MSGYEAKKEDLIKEIKEDLDAGRPLVSRPYKVGVPPNTIIISGDLCFEDKLKKAKAVLYRLLLEKEENTITEKELDMMYALAGDKAIQEILNESGATPYIKK